MAAGTSANKRQTYRRRASGGRQMYIYGNTAPKPDYEPSRRVTDPARPRKRVSRQVRQNRRRAMGVGRSYLIFLTVAAALMLLVCVNYVRMRSELVSRSRNITALQEELANLSEENTTKYNAVMDSVNLEEVRSKAMNELGMVYADGSQIVEYDNPDGDYVRQYENIPEEGVLASSADTQK